MIENQGEEAFFSAEEYQSGSIIPNWTRYIQNNRKVVLDALQILQCERKKRLNATRRIEIEMELKTIIWSQFGAAIDTLEDALLACPDELWRERLYNERSIQPEFAEFWYVGYHALFWLDYYLSESVEDFAPPAPFTRSELESGLLPERVYTKTELQAYLEFGRNKCRARLETLTDAMLARIRPDWPGMSVAGSFLYNMRHVQEHAAQLSLFLGQKVGSAPGWVSEARSEDNLPM